MAVALTLEMTLLVIALQCAVRATIAVASHWEDVDKSYRSHVDAQEKSNTVVISRP